MMDHRRQKASCWKWEVFHVKPDYLIMRWNMKKKFFWKFICRKTVQEIWVKINQEQWQFGLNKVSDWCNRTYSLMSYLFIFWEIKTVIISKNHKKEPNSFELAPFLKKEWKSTCNYTKLCAILQKKESKKLDVPIQLLSVTPIKPNQLVVCTAKHE